MRVKLPGAEFAIVDIAKLREYCLDQAHPRGRHKARVFAAALNLLQPDAEFLRNELLRAAREVDAGEGLADQYGQRYFLDFELARNDRRATVRSLWIIRTGEAYPRLTSCFVLLK